MRSYLFVLSLFLFSLFHQVANAEGYWGVKAASMDIDAASYNNAFNVGLFVGAEFAQAGSNIVSLEGEFTTSIIDGDTNVAGTDWSVQTFALYAAMRTGKEAYIKIKAGIIDRDITLSRAGASVSGNDSGFSWGIGFGFNRYEIEFTLNDGGSNTDMSMLSLGYLF